MALPAHTYHQLREVTRLVSPATGYFGGVANQCFYLHTILFVRVKMMLSRKAARKSRQAGAAAAGESKVSSASLPSVQGQDAFEESTWELTTVREMGEYRLSRSTLSPQASDLLCLTDAQFVQRRI